MDSYRHQLSLILLESYNKRESQFSRTKAGGQTQRIPFNGASARLNKII